VTRWVSFVLGNPLRFADPSGHAAIEGTGGGLGPYHDEPALVNQINKIYRAIRAVYGPTGFNVTFVLSSQVLPHLSEATDSADNPKSKFNKELENSGILKIIPVGKLTIDAIEFVCNYGRPVYKQVKGPIPGGYGEAVLGSFLQFFKDINDPDVRSYQYLGRAITVGIEDYFSDSVATYFGSQVGVIAFGIGAVDTVETGPGAGFADGTAGLLTYLGTSYMVTQAIDEGIWNPLNKQVLPGLFH
jgi:hypothetical protein